LALSTDTPVILLVCQKPANARFQEAINHQMLFNLHMAMGLAVEAFAWPELVAWLAQPIPHAGNGLPLSRSSRSSDDAQQIARKTGRPFFILPAHKAIASPSLVMSQGPTLPPARP
jgi:hypothetical protein